MQFLFSLKEKSNKRKYIISLHLIVCFVLLITGIFEVLLFVFFEKSAQKEFAHFQLLKTGGMITFLLGLILLIFLIVKNKWLTNKKINAVLRSIELLLFISFTILALQYGIVYPAFIFGGISATLFFALFWENKAEKLVVTISEKGIRTPKHFLEWHEIEALIYRHQILTINTVDNHLYQWETYQGDTDEALLEEFCKAKIAAGIKNRGKIW